MGAKELEWFERVGEGRQVGFREKKGGRRVVKRGGLTERAKVLIEE